MVFGNLFGSHEHNIETVTSQKFGCGEQSGLHVTNNYSGSVHHNSGTTSLSYGGDHVGFNVSMHTIHDHSAVSSHAGIDGINASIHICF